jgi:hypothetical protein
MLSVFMLSPSVIMRSVFAECGEMCRLLRVLTLNVVILIVIILNVVVSNVMAPFKSDVVKKVACPDVTIVEITWVWKIKIKTFLNKKFFSVSAKILENCRTQIAILGNCGVCAEQKISFINEMKWYEIWSKTLRLS